MKRVYIVWGGPVFSQTPLGEFNDPEDAKSFINDNVAKYKYMKIEVQHKYVRKK